MKSDVRLSLKALFLICPLVLTAQSARANDCQIIHDAYQAMAKQSALQQTIALKDQKPMEMRIIGNDMYMNDGTSWSQIPAATGMREQMMKQMMPDASALENCKEAGSETINGIETTAYDYFIPAVEKMMAGTGQQRVFIGPDGLPYRMRSGDTDVTLTYQGVVAP